MIYRVRHRTTYRYGDPVSLSLNQCCLRPRDFAAQRCTSYAMVVTPVPPVVIERDDFFGNHHAVFNIGEPHREMVIDSQSELEVSARYYPDPESTLPWEFARDALRRNDLQPAILDAMVFVYASPMIRLSAKFAEYAAPSFPKNRPLLAALLDFTKRIKTEFTYDARATTLATRSEDVLEKKRGVCQDFAQLQAACLRSLGLATRYVSGYLLTHPPPGKPRLIGADASHCWVSVFSPELGWIDIDPTNGCFVDDEHITVAWGRDYQDVTPVKGVILGGGGQSITVSVDVESVS